MKEEAPKSAYELAMERLRKKDRDAGVVQRSVTGEQKAAIAELRRVYEAKQAEREILHQASLRNAADQETFTALEEDYRRERERVAAERDRKIEEIRKR
jgi:hypothetical protein